MVSSAALLSPARGGEGGDLITKICKKNLSFILTGSNDEKVLKTLFSRSQDFRQLAVRRKSRVVQLLPLRFVPDQCSDER